MRSQKPGIGKDFVVVSNAPSRTRIPSKWPFCLKCGRAGTWLTHWLTARLWDGSLPVSPFMNKGDLIRFHCRETQDKS